MSGIKRAYVDPIIDMWLNDMSPDEIAKELKLNIDDVLSVINDEEG